MRKNTQLATAGAALVALSAVAGCGGSSSDSASSSSTSGSGATGKSTITVLAAASLTEAFTTLAKQYEKEHPGTTIKLSFGASSNIVTQLAHGAPADVVALADTEASKKLPSDVGSGKTWTPFATNKLEIATPSGNPAHVAGLADLAKADTVLCAKQVPCGRAADKALTKVHVTPHVVSYEKDVKATLAKIVAGDAQAAVVYATDVRSAGSKVTGVSIPAESNVNTTLPIAVWNDDATARGFAALVTGDAGQKVLQSDGFGLPK